MIPIAYNNTITTLLTPSSTVPNILTPSSTVPPHLSTHTHTPTVPPPPPSTHTTIHTPLLASDTNFTSSQSWRKKEQDPGSYIPKNIPTGEFIDLKMMKDEEITLHSAYGNFTTSNACGIRSTTAVEKEPIDDSKYVDGSYLTLDELTAYKQLLDTVINRMNANARKNIHQIIEGDQNVVINMRRTIGILQNELIKYAHCCGLVKNSIIIPDEVLRISKYFNARYFPIGHTHWGLTSLKFKCNYDSYTKLLENFSCRLCIYKNKLHTMTYDNFIYHMNWHDKNF